MGSRGGNTTGPSNKGPVTGLTTIPTQTASMSTPTPTPIQNPSPTPSPTGTSIVRKDLGLQQYWHEDGPYPQPPDKNGAIVAHGDIRDDGSCHIKIFYSGDTVENLGHGTFRLVQLTVIGAATGGYKKAIYQYVVDNIQSQLGDCPII